MTASRFARPRLLAGWLLAAGATLAFAALALSLPGSTTQKAAAIAPCLAHHNSPDELTMFQLVQNWRAANVPGAPAMTLTRPLNDAAAGYAQFLIDHPSASGHYADGSDWSARALNCGFVSNASGGVAGGEALARDFDPGTALATMASLQGSGIWIPGNVGLPVSCAGVARATAADGRAVWVVLLMARSGPCPLEASQELPTPTPTTYSPWPTDTPTTMPTQPGSTTPTRTNTPTRTPTPTSIPSATFTPTSTFTPSPTATPTPTVNPMPWRLTMPQIARDE